MWNIALRATFPRHYGARHSKPIWWTILKACLPPIFAPDAKLLILGSLPGDQSLSRQQYYAHPRNQFWKLLDSTFQSNLAQLGYDARLAALKDLGIALWDVVAQADREGSLDGNLRSSLANDLPHLLQKLPTLKAVAFNGGTAFKMGMKNAQIFSHLEVVAMPSSSPAYTLPFEDKLERWRILERYID
jgi:double-stranded uracil-DNA glycosylase